MKSVACKPRAIDKEMIKLTTNKWREYFCTNYYTRHKKWPSMIILDDSTFERMGGQSYLLNQLRQAAENTGSVRLGIYKI